MSYSNSSQPRRIPIWGYLIALLVAAVVGYSAIRYFIDWSNYYKGHQAYQQADCTQAIHNYDCIINGWRLIDVGKYLALAQKEKGECFLFQAAVNMEQTGNFSAALVSYADFIKVWGINGSVLAEAAHNVNLPLFYLASGQVYDTKNDYTKSYLMYKRFLIEYPEHQLSAEVETALLANPYSCKRTQTLKNTIIAERTDFLPSLYYRCGQAYEDDGDWANAITIYESFLADYPSHPLASDAEAALARSIVAQAKAANAGEIPAPERSGSTSSGVTEVIIQNDSPERLRIVFSGPESRVEELGACSSCKNYTSIGPLHCPEQGPIGHYTIKPGQYDVVVEASSSSRTTPWSGNWNLDSGDEYYSCFFIVSTFLP